MKAVTEFASFTLTKALAAQAALTAEGKTPEEIQQSLGATFKLEGEKLGYFIQALDVASKNAESLKRVIIVRLNEGETAPAKATKVDELYFVPEFLILNVAKPAQKGAGGKGGRPGGGRGGGGPKGSPWGLSPEEKAAKNGKKPAAKPS
jgi:hypothetical protein